MKLKKNTVKLNKIQIKINKIYQIYRDNQTLNQI